MSTNLPNLTFLDDGSIRIKNVRMSYPHLFEAWGKNPGDKKKFSGKFLLDKTTHKPEIMALMQHLQKLAQEAFKAKIPLGMYCLRNGAEDAKPETENAFVLSASESTRPTVLGKNKAPLAEADGVVYAGCYVHVLIRPWAQNNQYGKRINANLYAVQFARDGDPFSSIERPDIDEAFEDESDEGTGVQATGDGFDDDDIPF